MRTIFAAFLAIASPVTTGYAQENADPATRVEPAIPVPESEIPVSPPDTAVEPVASPDVGANLDVGAPAGAETVVPNPKPAPAAPAPAVVEKVAPPKPAEDGIKPSPAKPAQVGKPLDWEQNIVRVSILDDMRAITIPVEGKEAMGQTPADAKLPRVVSPYPPKALSPIPEGWQLFTDTSVPVRIHRVKFKDGRTLDIGVFPPALMPANPDATTVVLPQSAGNLLGAITAAREAQAASKAKLEALLEAMNRQMPTTEPESPPMP